MGKLKAGAKGGIPYFMEIYYRSGALAGVSTLSTIASRYTQYSEDLWRYKCELEKQPQDAVSRGVSATWSCLPGHGASAEGVLLLLLRRHQENPE